MLPAALTLLIGIGEVGQRVAAGAWERLERDPLAQAGGVRLLAIPSGEPAPSAPAAVASSSLGAVRGSPASPGPDASAARQGAGAERSRGDARGDALGQPTTRRDAIREAVQQLTRQRTVAGIEQSYAIRRPAGRYLRLQVVCIAALAETPANLLLEYARVLRGIKHPAAGLEVLFVLDAMHPRDPDEVTPDALSTLEALQDEWHALAARSRRDWSAAPRLRCFLAHPVRADGSRLAVRASGGFTPGYASGAPSGRTAPEGQQRLAGGETPGSPAGRGGNTPGGPAGAASGASEYEATLAAAIAGHVAPGALHDALAAGIEPDSEEPPFALLGWASDLFPRELLLAGAARLLAADLLERTGKADASRQAPDARGEEASSPRAPGAWRLASASEASLDRRRLLIRLLSPDVEESPIQVDAEPRALRLSLYQRLRERIWGRSMAGTASRGAVGGGPDARPLHVRLDLRAGAWRSSDPRRWPAELLAQDARGEQEFDAAVQLLQDQQLSQKAVQELVDALARHADLCVRRHLGGTQAARELIDGTLREAERGVRQANAVSFGEPDPPRDLGLPAGAGLEEAWRLFQLECERLPGWPAVLARGLAFGALGTTACGALGADAQSGTSLLFLGWVGVAVSVATAILWYGGALGRLHRLGEYVAECVRAKYGRRLLEYAQLAAGTPKREGVYQAVSRHLHGVEIPTLERFEAEREALIDRMRQTRHFSPPDGTIDELLAEATEAAELYRSARESLRDSCLTEEALELLRDHDIYASWRGAGLDRLPHTAGAYARRQHLLSWERKPLGDFLRDLLRLREAPERLDEAFAVRVTGCIDRLALRSVPLALGPFGEHGARSTEHEAGDAAGRPATAGASRFALRAPCRSAATVTVAVPASLAWHEGDADSSAALPADSVAGSLATWFGQSPNAVCLQVEEADVIACVVTIAGLSPAAALHALGLPPAEHAARSTQHVARNEEPLASLAANDSEAAPLSGAASCELRAARCEEERRA